MAPLHSVLVLTAACQAASPTVAGCQRMRLFTKKFTKTQRKIILFLTPCELAVFIFLSLLTTCLGIDQAQEEAEKCARDIKF